MARVLYEVVITVAPEIRHAYVAWLKPHVAALLAIDGFEAAELFINSEDPNEFTHHYHLRDNAAMSAYLAGPAKAMRADGVERFGDKFSARRRILEIQERI